MSKGLKLTLVTVAVAMMAVQAMAMAPVIKDIPSPVVGDAEDSTPANQFVYPDALNPSAYVSDDTSPAASILWTFDTAGASKYKINGHAALAGADPLTASPINTSVIGGEVNPDNNAATLTIRNSNLSPTVGAGGTNPGANDASGVIDSQTQLVTFYASDGSTVSAQGTRNYSAGQQNSDPVYFYTFHGADHLSPSQPPWVNVGTWTFPSNTSGWTFVPGRQQNATSQVGANGICITVPAPGENLGIWNGPYGMLPLVAHNVYRIRATIIGSQAAGTTNDVPLWDLLISNYSPTGQGANLYGLNYFFLDNTGRANAALNSNKVFEAFWCPSPISTAQWNNATEGIFAAQNDTLRDGLCEFRILDVGAGAGGGAENRLGTLCLNDLQVDRMDDSILSHTAGAPLYNPTSLTDGSTGTPPGNTYFSQISVNNNVTWNKSFGASGVTMTPTTQGSQQGASGGNGLARLDPGDNVQNPSVPSTYADDYPCAMTPQTLYLVSMDIAAPTANDANAPPDQFWIGADTPTNELVCLTYVTGSGANSAGTGPSKCAMPTTTAATYKVLFWSNYATDPANPAIAKTFRPRFMVANGELTFTSNTGAIRIQSMRVDQLDYTE